MNVERVWAFLDEGIVGFAALVLAVVVVLPMLPLIAVGYGFSRLLAQVDTRRMAETGTGSVRSTGRAAPKGCAHD